MSVHFQFFGYAIKDQGQHSIFQSGDKPEGGVY